ncbi:MAG: ribosome biogenesis GTPase Der [Candidatus Marinimicrobia bacterium]|mgnify:CR=1 FL=1|jgi:GTP-binding protein|nr:ribosome biogenesis GTPase Der [Candidatus Neomarinimicrobiota bacterium]MBT3936186.1 ribosome biogenesis GTPase Der [Candidatus Neomarinimicrobiota bacterium]MBT3960512.1 ribosome biogenesis GTPase Der [Candidatus Neomarinimicrobiota bacterium]MBT4384087.1 ribosome biogenesis GTPase Der [Candidatus Neomarinimicrobiota bacterium]MBT4637058.1 ribosome biogenesis GTPase Der [Candidatus Neomarinimicrobiota bacterium]
MKSPLIAIVGRPNVGKSTFFNRVIGGRQAIVDAQEGITRDRIYGSMDWTGYTLRFVDTGGYIPEDVDIFNAAVREQAELALLEADMVLFLVDGKENPTASDRTLAQFIRETGKPCLLAVNKCDGLKDDPNRNAFFELGFETLVSISALNGRLTGDLLDEIVALLGLEDSDRFEDENQTVRLAVVGMPNVGKSSLTNALLKREQSIVTPIAGTTRDAIDSPLKWHGKDFTLVDTAGLRKLSKITDKIEYYSTVRSQKAIDQCDIALVLIDAEKGFGKQDKAIVDHVIEKGKGLIFVVNKWDLISKDTNTMKDFADEIRYQFKALNHYPILFISADTHQRIHKVLELADQVYERSRNIISARKLNDYLKQFVRKSPPPAEQGKVIKLKYLAQVHRAPAVFAFYTNYPKLIKTHYKRHVENSLRVAFDLKGIPVRISFRKS